MNQRATPVPSAGILPKFTSSDGDISLVFTCDPMILNSISRPFSFSTIFGWEEDTTMLRHSPCPAFVTISPSGKGSAGSIGAVNGSSEYTSFGRKYFSVSSGSGLTVMGAGNSGMVTICSPCLYESVPPTVYSVSSTGAASRVGTIIQTALATEPGATIPPPLTSPMLVRAGGSIPKASLAGSPLAFRMSRMTDTFVSSTFPGAFSISSVALKALRAIVTRWSIWILTRAQMPASSVWPPAGIARRASIQTPLHSVKSGR